MPHRRGVLNLDCALAVGHSMRYAAEPNGESYMELVVRCRATSTADTHIMKANHPDDARNWVRDFQVRRADHWGPVSHLNMCTRRGQA